MLSPPIFSAQLAIMANEPTQEVEMTSTIDIEAVKTHQ